MPGTQQDVNREQVPSTAQGVMADSPPANDVNVSAPSAEETMSQKPHEDAIPYSRFKEEIDKNNQLKAELEALRSQYTEQPPEPFDWRLFPDQQPAQPQYQQPAPPAQQQQVPYTPEEIEARIREDLMNKPFQTLYPIMMEAAKQVIRDTKKQEARVRSIPDFKSYESDYYGVPEDVIAQTQSDPELIRYLLAKHRATVTGKAAKPVISNPNAFINEPSPPPKNGPSKPVNTMDDLAERYRKEGEQRVLERLRSQQGLTAEGASTIQTQQTDEPELDAEGVALMAKLGIPQTQIKNVAKRLDNFVRGK